MAFLGRLFARKKGGTLVGNAIRRVVNNYTMGISNALGVTDGHMVDGNPDNGEYDY